MFKLIPLALIVLTTTQFIGCNDSNDQDVASEDSPCREYCDTYQSCRASAFKDEFNSIQECTSDCLAGQTQTEKEMPDCAPLAEEFTICLADMTCAEVEDLANDLANNTINPVYPCTDVENDYTMCLLEYLIDNLDIDIQY